MELGGRAAEGGEDVVVSVLALSVSRQKPNQSSTNAPKMTAHFYLSPQIRAGVDECGIFKTWTSPPIQHSMGVYVHVYACMHVHFVTVCVLFGCVCLRKSLISFLGLSAIFRENNSSFLLS